VLNAERPPAVSSFGDVPAAFDTVVARAMARVPADRFSSAEDFAAGLRAALVQSESTSVASLLGDDEDATVVVGAPRGPAVANAAAAVAAKPVSPAKQTAAPAARRAGIMPLALGGVALVAVAGAGGAFLLLRGGSTPLAAPSATPAPAKLTPAPTLPAQPPPVAPPATPKPAPPDPAIVARAVTAAAAGAKCSLLATSVGADGVQVEGFAGSGDAEATARSAVATASSGLAVAWHASGLDPQWCRLLDVLRPAVSAGTVHLALSGGHTSLADRDPIEPDITMPSFPGWLVVDYLTHDDTLHDLVSAELYPNPTARGHLHTSADVVKVRSGNTIGPPFGTDLIVAMATTKPLFTKVRPSQVFGAYLSSLQNALDGAARRGDQVAVGIMTVETQAHP
jgi:eukaryotic-like serine/threonine-protein kinase